jgi:hypothetical protein
VIGLDVLEVELRSLPGVTSVAVDDAQVSVLGLPDADADALRVLVSAVLATHAVDRTVRVLGGRSRPVARRHPRRFVAVAAVVMILAGVAATVTGVRPNGGASGSVREPFPASIGRSASEASWLHPIALLPNQVAEAAAAAPAPVAAGTPPPSAVTAPPLEMSVFTVAAPIVKAPSLPPVVHLEPTSAVVPDGSGLEGHDHGPRSGTDRSHPARKSSVTKSPRHGPHE